MKGHRPVSLSLFLERKENKHLKSLCFRPMWRGRILHCFHAVPDILEKSITLGVIVLLCRRTFICAAVLHICVSRPALVPGLLSSNYFFLIVPHYTTIWCLCCESFNTDVLVDTERQACVAPRKSHCRCL